MTPFVHLFIDCKGKGSPGMLGNDGLRAALIEVSDDNVAVEGLVAEQGTERETVDQRGDTHRVEPLAGQQNETHEIAERVGESKDLGRHASLGAADGLALSPPFAPCP
jgi:hypothetical protein